MNSSTIIPFHLLFFFCIGFLFSAPSSFSIQNIPSSEEYKIQLPPLSLIGVIISEGTYPSVAILKNERTGKTLILTEGESITGLELIQVIKNRIILQKDEKTIQIFLGSGRLTIMDEKPQNAPSETSSTDRNDELSVGNQSNKSPIKKEFNRSEVEKRIENEWPTIIKGTRFVPNIVNGEVSGFKITKLPVNSILSEIGIHKNDIIKEINGVKLSDAGNVFGLYNKFKDENQFEVHVERDGKLFRLIYILK